MINKSEMHKLVSMVGILNFIINFESNVVPFGEYEINYLDVIY